jgi:transcriptional regulator with XRE-family HTH domain
MTPIEATRPRPRPIGLLLRARGITNRALAERVNVSPFWLGQIINGKVEPSPRLRVALAAALGVAEDELF